MKVSALSAALAVSACSSSYVPQNRGRIAVVLESGQMAYVRDGKTYHHGLLGGGLEDAVRGNAAAEQAADEYTGRFKLGLLGTLGGLGCLVASTSYAVRSINQDGGNDDAAKNFVFFTLGCSVVTLISSLYLASAEPYRWDAINLFNDAPPPPPGILVPPARGWSPPSPSLKMRD